MAIGTTDAFPHARRAVAGVEFPACRRNHRRDAAGCAGPGKHRASGAQGAGSLPWADIGWTFPPPDGVDRTRLGVGFQRGGGPVGRSADAARILLHTERGPPAADAPPGRSASLLLFESSAQEFHWCFLRGAVWDLLIQPLYSSGGFELGLQSGPEQIQYWAVWIAAALSLPGIGIQRGRMSERLITLLILAATSTLFLYTRNFWLCCLLHLGIRVILQWGQPTRQRAI